MIIRIKVVSGSELIFLIIALNIIRSKNIEKSNTKLHQFKIYNFNIPIKITLEVKINFKK